MIKPYSIELDRLGGSNRPNNTTARSVSTTTHYHCLLWIRFDRVISGHRPKDNGELIYLINTNNQLLQQMLIQSTKLDRF